MQASSRTPANDFDEFAGFDDEPPPDSTVRPTAPPPNVRAREAPIPAGTRMLNLTIRVTPALLGPARSGYVTVTGPEGEVLFEGDIGDEPLELCMLVPDDLVHVKAMLEAGTKYRNANVTIASDGPTAYLFA